MRYFGVIGDPIAHSLSPAIHAFLFDHFGIEARYERFHLRSPDLLRSKLLSLHGANITLPHKGKAFEVCDEVRGIAEEIEAVNTIECMDDRLIGWNTDAFGFWECVRGLGAKTALILGAGGSAKAIATILCKQGIKVSLFNRSNRDCEFFAQRDVCMHEGVLEGSYDLLIHSTSVGLDGRSLPLEEERLSSLLARCKHVFDVIYPSRQIASIEDFKRFLSHRPPTALLAFAQRGMDGLEMLLYQALFAFEIFSQGKGLFEESRALFYNARL